MILQKNNNEMTYKKQYDKWINSPYISEADKKALEELSDLEVYEAFYKTLEFGTGGMRGKMGIGTNRLNIYTIRMASKAIAIMLREKKTARVVIAYDTRNGSHDFAQEAAKVLAASGVKAYLFDRPSPVPLLSFAVRELGADAGIVITASHNTKEYNGFKAYDSTGCQMLPDKTEIIAKNMSMLEDPLAIETIDMDGAIIDKGMVVPLDKDIIEKYMEAISGCGYMNDGVMDANLKVVYTPLHGSGRDYVMNALGRAGFVDVTLLREQADYNGDFPTVTKPNPEDSKALELAVNRAYEIGADIVIGTDPDCDRVGVAVINKDAAEGEPKAEYLTGNQIGALLIDYLCACDNSHKKTSKPRQLITTIVTSALGPIIAERNGIDVNLVLTGFKYIGEIMNKLESQGKEDEFLMGYEESYGYLTGGHARDKDGVSSSLAICRMAAYHKLQGKTLTERLDELSDKYGYWLDSQESFVFEGSEGEKIMANIMEEFRIQKENLFTCLCDESGFFVEYMDLLEAGSGLPKADVLKYTFSNGSFIAIRPSGTEPKLKVYYCMGDAEPLKTFEYRRLAAECIHTITDRYIEA